MDQLGLSRRPGQVAVLIAGLLVAASVGGACSKGISSVGPAPTNRIERVQGGPPAPAVTGLPRRSEQVVQVVATTSIAADWVRILGGVNVRTRVVVKAGLDPLAYLATAADVGALQRADLVVAVGRGLEPWLDQARQSAGTTKPVVTLTDGLPERTTASGARDPYLWLDLGHARTMVATLTAALAAADPADAAAFITARDAYLADLDQADAELRRVLGPVAGRGLVTAKETFGWFAARYGLDVVGSVVPSLNGRADIAPQHLATLRQTVKDKQVKAIFGEASVPDAAVRALATDTASKAVVGSDALLGDGLGPAGTSTDNFLSAMRHNAKVIAANV